MRAHGWGLLSLWLVLPLAGLIAGCGSEADRVVGTWQGALDLGRIIPQQRTPGTTLRVVCHIRKGSDGTLTGTLDSPDQGASGIPIDAVTIKEGAFHLQANKVFASYDGRLSQDGSEIDGQWQQGPSTLAMALKKSR